jgi:magnesium-transporting ATPase (P-type)
LKQLLKDAPKREELLDGSRVYEFFRLLAVCNTVVVEDDNGVLSYQASSPDELALIQGALQVGLRLKENSTVETIIENLDTKKLETYKVLAEFPFDSTRKRMSKIIQFDGKILLMCKGADSIILPRCEFRSEESKAEEIAINFELLNFAKEGLRTLVVA